MTINRTNIQIKANSFDFLNNYYNIINNDRTYKDLLIGTQIYYHLLNNL